MMKKNRLKVFGSVLLVTLLAQIALRIVPFVYVMGDLGKIHLYIHFGLAFMIWLGYQAMLAAMVVSAHARLNS
jgi:hypothetical protein